ncbi:LysR family transcriptional regulator [Duganella sp. BJB488]|uniref:LysR family transcriptional regulator n=1 Tax=unclassified Duganella TaxID=2636909 RepID=UPI000E3521DF|nr:MULTISPECIES: LysR family transcriptional regulator [unclassified Duganella]RFP13928.1 LysR family transcriptional regulator [Duganella sp. BJB489]RFP17489.1 LysR family transcriptional regulator [Duganella sp. BJB488]RFP31723.1 LysR family transcriptional regulator [Duganella sp. BJB480]
MSLQLPLNALHVFCVVVQEGGFRQAAQALHLTPGAVSRQVRSLEAHLRQVLFDRNAGAPATLTPAGRKLHDGVGAKMAAIKEALDTGGRARRQASILVDTSVTLAMHWLIPQLPAFRERHPRLNVQIRTVEGDIDPASPADVFLRRDVAELRGLPFQTFMRERSVLVASPAFMSGMAARKVEQLRWLGKAPRIGTRSRPDLWPGWCGAHGLDAGALEPTLELDNTVLAIQAAVQGLGALVVPEAFARATLDIEALRCLSGPVDSGSYSYAIGRRQASARVTIFTEWLKEAGRRENERSVSFRAHKAGFS